MLRLRSLPAATTVALLLTCAMGTGCVERVLVVETAPPGARVLVDGRDRGTTPLRLPYVHDGTFRVRLELEGYESVSDEIVTPTEADAVPGIDFFAENVWPGRIRRATVRRYDLHPLEPYTDAQLEAILRQADAFRGRTRREVAEPGTPQPVRPPSATPAPAPAPRAPAGR